jgi:large subunit ribosomal protein L23
MTKIYDIIQGPIITEKTMALKEKENKYTFKCLKSANKVEIKNAVEEIFKVKVLSINTVNVLPKRKRVGRFEGFAPAYKKAICKLAEGDKIEAFEI